MDIKRENFDALFDRIKKAQNGDERMTVPYSQALREIGFGKKRSHWIWYVIPSHKKIRPTTRKPQFLLPSIEAHRAYLGNEILRKRLMDILVVTLSHLTKKGKTLKNIYGAIDSGKVRETCSMFAIASLLEFKNSRYTTKDISKTLLQLCVGILESDVKRSGIVRLHPKVLRVYHEETSSELERFETTADISRLASVDSHKGEDEDDGDISTKIQERKEESRPVFEWRESHNKWIPFSQEISDKIERARIRGECEARYRVSNKPYTLDFSRMKQRNLRSGFERDVRRRMAVRTNEEVKTCDKICQKYEWMWFDGDNWIAYASDIAKRLESAKRKNFTKTVSFTTNHGHRYRVNVETMTQTNLRTNFSRRVRRVVRQSGHDEKDGDSRNKTSTLSQQLPPPPAPQKSSFKNILLGRDNGNGVVKASKKRAKFAPKRSSGPLRNYCETCSLHKARHETFNGELLCPIASSL